MTKYTVSLNSSNFGAQVLEENNLPVLVDFWAEWCGPCKMVAPVLEEVAKEYEGKLKVCKVDVDEDGNDELSAKYSIRGIPTLLLFKQGRIISTQVGAISKSQLVELIKPSL